MELESINREAVSHFLRLAEAEGWNWAAFNHDPESNRQTHIFHGFESANEAEEFCNDNNLAFDVYEQDLETANYCYMPVETLQSAYLATKETPVTAISLDRIAGQMARDGIRLLPGKEMVTLKPFLQKGLIFPVQWTKMINPSEEIARFLVISHHHPGHQVYEIGHSVRVIDSFPSLEKAEQCFQEWTRQCTDNTDKNDYLLIGQYKGQEFKHDLEGWPESYSGITLKTAHYQYDQDLQEKAWNVQEIHALEEPKGVRHFLYAKYDIAGGKLKLYDDRLKETRPEDLKVSTYPGQFNYEKLTIKNSIAMEMNMKNYDYLKNQVKFLGFGENLDNVLKEKIQTQEQEFTIPHQAKFGQDEVSSTLHFSKSKESEMYFFNGYDLALKQPGKEDVLNQSYYVGKENNYTLKERYNMLDGRAVFKELNKLVEVGEGDEKKLKASDQTYKAWKDLDFKQTDKLGNFLPKTMFWDHIRVLEKYPIKELETPYDRSRLVASLAKGNVTKMTVIKDGEEIKGTMAANPRQQRFDFYDSNNQRVEVKQVEKQQAVKQEQGENNTVGRENSIAEQKQSDTPVVQLQNNKDESAAIGKENQAQSLKSENKDTEKVNQTRRQRMRVS